MQRTNLRRKPLSRPILPQLSRRAHAPHPRSPGSDRTEPLRRDPRRRHRAYARDPGGPRECSHRRPGVGAALGQTSQVARPPRSGRHRQARGPSGPARSSPTPRSRAPAPPRRRRSGGGRVSSISVSLIGGPYPPGDASSAHRSAGHPSAQCGRMTQLEARGDASPVHESGHPALDRAERQSHLAADGLAGEGRQAAASGSGRRPRRSDRRPGRRHRRPRARPRWRMPTPGRRGAGARPAARLGWTSRAPPPRSSPVGNERQQRELAVAMMRRTEGSRHPDLLARVHRLDDPVEEARLFEGRSFQHDVVRHAAADGDVLVRRSPSR